MKLIIVLFTIFVLQLNVVYGAGCVLQYATDFPDKEPVLLYGSTLIEPTFEGIYLDVGEEISIFCAGSRNKIDILDVQYASAKCVNDKTLNINGVRYTFDQLGCSTIVTGEFEATVTKCASSGVIKNLGYNLESQFLSLINICYDNDEGAALYSKHVVYGSAIDHGKTGSSRPSFKVGGLAAGVNAAKAYQQANQKLAFAEILGSTDLAAQYIYTNSYLARGHLSPDADMVYVSSSYTTYFYINTVPQWQAINNGNWKSLEAAIRKVASNLQEDIEVYTGGFEVLELPDVNNNLAAIYLSDGKLPVPKFVWKVMYSLSTKKAIAFVSLNNPFIEDATDDEYLCNNVCGKYGWGTTNWNNAAKGLVYCCEVDDLRKTVTSIPKLSISGTQDFDATL